MIEPVDPKYLYRIRDWFLEGLSKITDKLHDDWHPADVYAEVRAGQSHLYTVNARGERIGFVVLQLWPVYHAGPRLFIRALWCEPGKLAPHQQDFMESLEDLARKHGAVAIRHLSPRRWDGSGFKLKQYVFEREVSHG